MLSSSSPSSALGSSLGLSLAEVGLGLGLGNLGVGAWCGLLGLVLGLTCWPWQVRLRLPLETMRSDFLAKKRHEAHWTSVDVRGALAEQCPRTGLQYLVVGGGFVGSKVLHQLFLRGDTRVRVLDLTDASIAPEFRARVDFVRGDVSKAADMLAACAGVDVVLYNAVLMCFHQRLPGAQAEVAEKVNVGGPRNAVAACLAHNVRCVVYTSSSAVMQVPGEYSNAMDESGALCTRKRSFNHYSWTKAEAERVFRAAHGKTGSDGATTLRTGVVRACGGIYGFRDRINLEALRHPPAIPVWIPGIADFIGVDNLVFAHLLVERFLETQKPPEMAVYCITDEEPMYYDEYFLGATTVLQDVFGPKPLMLFRGGRPVLLVAVGEVVELLQRFAPGLDVGSLRMLAPGIQNAMMHGPLGFSCAKARRDLGYKPLFSWFQMLQKTVAEYERDTMLPEA